MSTVRRLPWLRIVAEGTAIVVSILLAFAIDAWWERELEEDQAEELVESLRADFAASQAHVVQWRRGNERILSALLEFRDRIVSMPVGAEITVPEEWLIAAVSTPTYSPTDATLAAAISSGRIELIHDRELRDLLAQWRQQLDDTREDEILVRRIVVDQLVPVLADYVRLGPVFEFDRIIGWFLDSPDSPEYGEVRLTVSSPFEGQLAERVFYSTFIVQGLADIEMTQAEILGKLDELGGG